MKRLLYVLAVFPVLPVVPVLSAMQRCGEFILATTTSTQDTGLLDSLLPMFKREACIEVKPTLRTIASTCSRPQGSSNASGTARRYDPRQPSRARGTYRTSLVTSYSTCNLPRENCGQRSQT